MRKVDDGEEKKKKEKKKIMTFIVATNVVATRPPERRPTGTPHDHAKNESTLLSGTFKLSENKGVLLFSFLPSTLRY